LQPTLRVGGCEPLLSANLFGGWYHSRIYPQR
jgi:hypothetical protein